MIPIKAKLLAAILCTLFIAAPVCANELLTPMEQIIRKSRPRMDIVIVRKIIEHINYEAEVNDFNPNLIAGLMWAESRFKPTAESHKGAIGLMQVRYEDWKDSPILKDNGVSGKDKLFWIAENIKCGVQILRKYLNEANGDIVLALYRYNTGKRKLPGGVRRYQVSFVSQVMIKTYEISEYIRKAEENVPE